MRTPSFAVGLVLFLAFPALADQLHGRVVGVHDGDTLTLLAAGNVQHKIRPDDDPAGP